MKHVLFLILLLACVAPAFAQWHIDENFDTLSTLPAGWITYDDGDGQIWQNLNNASHAHSGTRAAFVDNYFPNQNSDWLISPQITVSGGDSLHFYTRSWTSTENLKVYISTTGTAISNFGTQLAHIQNIGVSYQQVNLSLSAFEGQQVYLGFFWQCSNYAILIDDIRIGQPLIINPELNLPESYSFFQGESLSVDFSPYIVATELVSTSISWQPTQHVVVSNQGLNVSFSSPDWAGTEDIIFTMTDQISSLSATDTLQITVNPTPAIDLALLSSISPRMREYVGSPFIPSVVLTNNGLNLWDDQVLLHFDVLNNSGTNVLSSEAFYSGALQVQQTATVSFPAATLLNAGLYTASFTLGSEDGNPTNNILSVSFEVVQRVSTGGPDAFGFRFIDSNAEGGPVFNWIDISSTGTSTIMYGVNQWNGDDNFSESIPLGFDFPYYGSSYNTANVDVNGEILLATNTWYTPFPGQGWGGDGNMFNYMYPIPGYTQMPGLISVYWDDLHADQDTGDVYFQSFGETPDRYTVIQWHNIRFHAGTNATALLDFEVILHENGEIVMQYNNVATGQTGATIPHDYGKSSTIALQNDNATVGLSYLREIVQNNQYIGVEPAGNLLHNGLAIRFYSGVDQQTPVITASQPGNTFELSPMLSARVIDQSELQTVAVLYNTGSGWQTLNGMPTGQNNYDFALPTIPQGSTLQYYYLATDILGNSSTLPTNAPSQYYSFDILPTADTNVLLAYSGSQDYQRTELAVYEDLLNDLNISYDKYNWEEYPAYGIPAAYTTVLAYASVGSQSPKALYFATVLMDYLNAGSVAEPNNLLLASDGYAFSQGGTPNSNAMKQLLNGYLRTSYIATGLGGGTNGLSGPESLNYQSGTILCVNGSPIGDNGFEYSVYANSPDCIFGNDAVPDWYADMVPYPEIGSVNAFAFEDGPVNGQAYLYHGVCGTTVQVPNFRAFYFSFDLSQLNNPNQREELFASMLSWFEVSPSAVAEDIMPSAVSAILGNYPNPFNPSTTISYYLASSASLELEIYNIKGQRIKKLLNAPQTAGKHTLSWNGRDDNGNEVGSGIYFIKLSDGKLTDTRKMTLIK